MHPVEQRPEKEHRVGPPVMLRLEHRALGEINVVEVGSQVEFRSDHAGVFPKLPTVRINPCYTVAFLIEYFIAIVEIADHDAERMDADKIPTHAVEDIGLGLGRELVIAAVGRSEHDVELPVARIETAHLEADELSAIAPNRSDGRYDTFGKGESPCHEILQLRFTGHIAGVVDLQGHVIRVIWILMHHRLAALADDRILVDGCSAISYQDLHAILLLSV